VELERQLASFCGARHCISCANGTDALLLALMAEGIGLGDAVFVPAFTFVATAEVAVLAGATPVFVDVRPDTFNLDVESLEAAIGEAKRRGLKPRCVIPVDLYGQPADYKAINKIAAAHGVMVLADAAQSFGASLDGKKVGTLATYTATSFYPSKPLGGYGDGGAHCVTTARVLAGPTPNISVSTAGSIRSRPPSCWKSFGCSRRRSRRGKRGPIATMKVSLPSLRCPS
jgi:dTDP-4-amino-4,6-dideoxygalactose transaminase